MQQPPAPLPNFLIIGAPKCGTTALYHWLEGHPDISLSTPKEPYFFEDEYHLGPEHYWQTYFASRWRGEAHIGEARTANLYLPYVPQRIHATVPHARLIAILRNPVDRAFSHWWMMRCMGREPLGFDRALHANSDAIARGDSLEGPRAEEIWRAHIGPLPDRPGIKRVSVRNYLEAGHYATHIERYLQYFPRSQLCILFHDDLVSAPLETLREVYRFLGLEAGEVRSLPPRENVALSNFSRPLYRLSRKLRAERFLPRRFLALLRTQLSRVGSRPKMSPEARDWLRRHYHPHNQRLERITGRNLGTWDA